MNLPRRPLAPLPKTMPRLKRVHKDMPDIQVPAPPLPDAVAEQYRVMHATKTTNSPTIPGSAEKTYNVADFMTPLRKVLRQIYKAAGNDGDGSLQYDVLECGHHLLATDRISKRRRCWKCRVGEPKDVV